MSQSMAKLSDIDLSRLATILTDSAYQVNRANPLGGVALHEPCPGWMEAYVETVLEQIDAAVAEDDADKATV